MGGRSCPSVVMLRRAEAFRLLPSAVALNQLVLTGSVVLTRAISHTSVLWLVPRGMELHTVCKGDNAVPTWTSRPTVRKACVRLLEKDLRVRAVRNRIDTGQDQTSEVGIELMARDRNEDEDDEVGSDVSRMSDSGLMLEGYREK